MKNYFKFLIILALGLSNSSFLYSQTITIAAASNFREPLTELIKAFCESNKETSIHTVFGSSGSLYHQLSQNAPFDLYFSADVSHPQKLWESGLALSKPSYYATGLLVLWSKSMDVSKGLSVLQSNKINKIAIANPKLAPYGNAAVECLTKQNLYDHVKAKLVLAENIAQTAQFAYSGNVDVAVIAKSQLISPIFANVGTSYLIPSDWHSPIHQAFVIIKKNANLQLSENFAKFVLSETGKNIFQKYGYLTTDK